MNVLPNILSYGSSGSSGTSGEAVPHIPDFLESFPQQVETPEPIDPTVGKPSFLSKLYNSPQYQTPDPENTSINYSESFFNTPLLSNIVGSESSEGDGQSFINKLFGTTHCEPKFTSAPVVCAANPCPITLNATCVFYEGPNLIYTGINTNDNLQTALEKIEAAIADELAGSSGTSGTSCTIICRN